MNFSDIERYLRLQDHLSRYGLTAKRHETFHDRIAVAPLSDTSCPPFSSGAQIATVSTFEELETWLVGFMSAHTVMASLGFDHKKIERARDKLRKKQLMDLLKSQEGNKE